MFGVSGRDCPDGFEIATADRFREVEAIVRRSGPPLTVVESWFLRRGRCSVALSVGETPPAAIVSPAGPKVTLALHGRPESLGVRAFLGQVDAGVGFVVPIDVEPLVRGLRRSPAILRLRALSGVYLRPDSHAPAPGRRATLGPRDLDALAALPVEGLGFLECHESLEHFLAEPFPGVASWVEDRIVSFTAVYARAEPWVEITSWTHPDERGQGHATATAAACAQEIVRRGGEPVWTAIDDASRRVGNRLGLVPAGERLYVEFDRPPWDRS